MFNEDNSGFVNFPHPSDRTITGKNIGKTLIYLVAFEPKRKNNGLSNVNINMPGVFLSDDVISRPDINIESSIDSIVIDQKINDQYDEFYFPNINSEEDLKNDISIDIITCICIGWSNLTYEFSNRNKLWNASYRDLTNEGSRLYYSIKKLHNSKEIRILTFNSI